MKNGIGRHEDLSRLERQSSRYRFVQSAARFFSRLVRLAAPGIVAILTAIFLARIFWSPLRYAIYALPAWLIAVGAYLAHRSELWAVPPSRADALADLASGNRGLYMSLREAGGEDWNPRVTGGDVRLKGRFPAGAMAGAVLLTGLLVAVLLMPDLRAETEDGPKARTPVEELAAVVEELEQNDLAEEEYLEDARELIRRLEQEETRALASEDWQALDRARDELKRHAADSYRRVEEQVGRIESLQRQLEANRTLSPDQAREASRLLEGFSAGDLEKLNARLNSGKPISPDMLKKLRTACRSGQCRFGEEEMEALKCLLKEAKKKKGQCAGACQGCLAALGFSTEELAAFKKGLPGRGGITRGPGPAPILHAGDTDPELGKFKAKTFRADGGEPAVPMGYTVAPPDGDVEEPASGAPGAARQFGPGNERITWHSRLLPRHNEVLRNYFAAEEPESGE